MLDDLSRPERLALVRFVCSFAWADLNVRRVEQEYIARLVRRLELDEDELQLVDGWLKLPPAPEEVDPDLIPRRHREVFLDAIKGVVAADLDIADEEKENYSLLEEMLLAEPHKD